MKKTLVLVMALVIGTAAFAAKPYFVEKGKKISVDTLKADASGTLSFKKGKFTQTIKRGKYEFAFDPDPTPVKQAYELYKKKNYKKAAADFETACKIYRYLGWGAFCKLYQAESLANGGEPAKAISLLQSWLQDYKPNKVEAKYYLRSNKLLANLLIDASKYDEAKRVLDTLEKTNNEDAAAFAFNGRGKILKKQGKLMDAVCQYLQTALLFGQKNNGREEAIFMVIKLLKEQNDPRAQKFIALLKNDYPSGDYIKQLK